jgi:hypothetical protein
MGLKKTRGELDIFLAGPIKREHIAFKSAFLFAHESIHISIIVPYIDYHTHLSNTDYKPEFLTSLSTT